MCKQLMLIVVLVLSILLGGCEKKKAPPPIITIYEDARLKCSNRFRVVSEEREGIRPVGEMITIIEDTETGIKYLYFYRFPHQAGLTRLWEKGQ